MSDNVQRCTKFARKTDYGKLESFVMITIDFFFCDKRPLSTFECTHVCFIHLYLCRGNLFVFQCLQKSSEKLQDLLQAIKDKKSDKIKDLLDKDATELRRVVEEGVTSQELGVFQVLRRVRVTSKLSEEL